MPTKEERLRERVQKIEQKLKAIADDRAVLRRSQRKREQAKRLILQRRRLLDEMFVATPEEVARMEQVNARLFDLTKKLYARTEELYRKTITTTYDPAFDNDVDIEGKLTFNVSDADSLLSMSNDDYYGSDFAATLAIIDELYPDDDVIEFSYCYCRPSDYRADMSSEELGVVDILNDGDSWYEACQPAADKLQHLCICHAINELNMHKPYSIPDILRMNDFWVEVVVKHQHFANQYGRVPSENATATKPIEN